MITIKIQFTIKELWYFVYIVYKKYISFIYNNDDNDDVGIYSKIDK